MPSLLMLRANREALRGVREAREKMHRDFRNNHPPFCLRPSVFADLVEHDRTRDAERSHYDFEPEAA